MGKAKKLAAPRPNLVSGFDPRTDSVRAEPLVLIVVPTRELATQIFDEARRLCYRSMLRPCVVYGGAPVRDQRDELQKGCDILIGTPGRLLDFMDKPHILSLRRVKYDAQENVQRTPLTIHLGTPSSMKLMSSSSRTGSLISPRSCPVEVSYFSFSPNAYPVLIINTDMNEDADHRYMMFSATFNKECRVLARKFLADDHVRVRIGRPGSTHINVDQNVCLQGG